MRRNAKVANVFYYRPDTNVYGVYDMKHIGLFAPLLSASYALLTDFCSVRCIQVFSPLADFTSGYLYTPGRKLREQKQYNCYVVIFGVINIHSSVAILRQSKGGILIRFA